jgi:hypothetical protein
MKLDVLFGQLGAAGRGFYRRLGSYHLAMQSLCTRCHNFLGAPMHLSINHLKNIIYLVKDVSPPLSNLLLLKTSKEKYTKMPLHTNFFSFLFILGVTSIINSAIPSESFENTKIFLDASLASFVKKDNYVKTLFQSIVNN